MGPTRNTARKPVWKRLLFSPLASLVLAVCLWLDAWSLPQQSLLAKVVTGKFIFGPRTSHCGHSDFLCLVRTDKGLSAPWDLPSPRDIDAEEWLLARCPGKVESQYLWAITGETIDHTFTLSGAGTITDAERNQARAIYAQVQEVRRRNPRMAHAVLSGDGTTTFPSWPGYLHNTLALSAFALFGASLAWLPRYALIPCDAERLASGRCPRCLYSLAGLREPRCPECGTTWSLAEPGRGATVSEAVS